MAKFDLKKAILENKATFFGSLTEGQFSWMTQDTGQQIGSEEENTIPVYMFDNKGNYYYENRYDGYGDFGGKDYYELLAQMNGYAKGDRMDGIDMAFGKMKTPNGGPVLFPALVTKPNEFNFKTHDFTKEAESDPNQSWYAPEEEEEDFIDQNDEKEYGYADDSEEEELDEVKTTNTKMKKSELKSKIKEMILNEINLDIDNMEDAPESEVDFLAELEGMLDEASEFDKAIAPRVATFIKSLDDLVDEYHAELYLSDDLYNAIEMVKKAANDVVSSVNEAKGDEEVTDDVTADDVTIDDTETIDTTTTTEVNPDVKAVQDALTQAQAAAQKLGDGKLTDQIGNTITFFTRAHVVEKGAVAEVEEMEEETLNESMFPMLNKILK
jgi:hypothetical protein